MNFSYGMVNKIKKMYKNILIQKKDISLKNKKTLQYIYNDIDSFFQNFSKDNIYLNLITINNPHDIPYPNNYNSRFFPIELQNYISERSIYYIESSLKIDKKTMNVKFIFQEEITLSSQKKVRNYLYNIYIWFHILNKYSSYKCSQTMTIYIYMTNVKKYLPSSKLEIINESNVNSAFTNSCPQNGEIIIYRKEEWFKVFIHETFHAYGMDFSDMNVSKSCERMKKIFKMNENIMLYEAYTELWAEIINILFCCYSIKQKEKDTSEDFEYIFNVLINVERENSIKTLIKVLNHSHIDYEMFVNKKVDMIVYNESTNVFSYYVIKSILLFFYNDFLEWCDSNNVLSIMFKKTSQNIDSFCDLIENFYNSKELLKSLEKIQKKSINVKNIRMSVCELS